MFLVKDKRNEHLKVKVPNTYVFPYWNLNHHLWSQSIILMGKDWKSLILRVLVVRLNELSNLRVLV